MTSVRNVGAEVDKNSWRVQINDFPDELMYA